MCGGCPLGVVEVVGEYHMCNVFHRVYVLKGVCHLFTVSSTQSQACHCACHCCAISLCCFSLKVSI